MSLKPSHTQSDALPFHPAEFKQGECRNEVEGSGAAIDVAVKNLKINETAESIQQRTKQNPRRKRLVRQNNVVSIDEDGLEFGNRGNTVVGNNNCVITANDKRSRIHKMRLSSSMDEPGSDLQFKLRVNRTVSYEEADVARERQHTAQDVEHHTGRRKSSLLSEIRRSLFRCKSNSQENPEGLRKQVHSLEKEIEALKEQLQKSNQKNKELAEGCEAMEKQLVVKSEKIKLERKTSKKILKAWRSQQESQNQELNKWQRELDAEPGSRITRSINAHPMQWLVARLAQLVSSMHTKLVADHLVQYGVIRIPDWNDLRESGKNEQDKRREILAMVERKGSVGVLGLKKALLAAGQEHLTEDIPSDEEHTDEEDRDEHQ